MLYINLPIFVHSLTRPRIGSIPWTATCYYLIHQRKCGGKKWVKASILQRLVFFKVGRISPPFRTSLPASCVMSGNLVLLGGVTREGRCHASVFSCPCAVQMLLSRLFIHWAPQTSLGQPLLDRSIKDLCLSPLAGFLIHLFFRLYWADLERSLVILLAVLFFF